MSDPIASRLDNREFLILDGGLATELQARGHDLSDGLWSARLLADDPHAILAVHRDYLDAGADGVISASYQASFDGFRVRGLTDADIEGLLLRSVALARAAVGDGPGFVAASIGPYGAARADGAEYTGAYDLDEAGLYAWHRRRFEVLAGSGADLLAMETIPSLSETRALLRLLDETDGVPGWFSFSCADGGHLADGTSIEEAARLVTSHPGVVAVGVNCTAPGHVLSLLSRMSSEVERPLLCYPNSGETWDAQARSWCGERAPESFAQLARSWRDAGARLIGGCCRTTPEHVRQVAGMLRAP